jgi:hypothetical protein
MYQYSFDNIFLFANFSDVQVHSLFPTDKEIRIALRKLGLKDVAFSILKTIEFVELSERNLKTVITSKPQSTLEELLKKQLLEERYR